MKKGLRLWMLLAISFISVLLVVTTLFYLLISYQNTRYIQKEEGNLLLRTGKLIADDSRVLTALEKGESSDELQAFSQKVTKLYQLDFTVILNMDGTRLTHPNQQQIGKPFQGGDEAPALEGKEHLSTSAGTLGESLRGFVPVFYQEKQIGVVALGITTTSLGSLINKSKNDYTMALFISLAIGLLMAFLITYFLKLQLHNLEPKEIARLLEERNAMLNETKDAVFVVDLQQKILLTNHQAEFFAQQKVANDEQLIGLKLNDIFEDLEQLDLSQKNEQFYQQAGQDYFFSAAPIIVKNSKIGSILFLRNATETLFLADQLSSTTNYATALQNQAHEFMNKLHVIYGLAELGAYEKLNDYLKDIIQPEKELISRLAILVNNPLIAGFLLNQRQKFLEEQSHLWVEITPEIPKTDDPKVTEQLLNLYRFVEHFLFQWELPAEILLQINYQDQRLQTTYSFVATSEQVASIEKQFSTLYFNNTLEALNGTFDWHYQQDYLQLIFKTDYRGEIDDHHFNFRG
ncbi:Spo0B domain-containing protein [Enterococcus alishanensis]|uniref:Sensor histidine kinase n=1 Tax=Enterococcus alishanensis TaxID=1303817 RepID=A0ABS6T914_9ENTE|nr:sensor histidine kinase [Enterococcus alishanensis]MBV7389394.1 sensor histidine kinase [Enterococcus alishanensis]